MNCRRDRRGRFAKERKTTKFDKFIVCGALVYFASVLVLAELKEFFSYEVVNAKEEIVGDVVEGKEDVVYARIQVVYSEERIIEKIRKTFPEAPNTAVAVAKCESSLRPDAINTQNYDDSIDRGLMQINSVHDPVLFKMGLDPFDVDDALEFSRHLYDQSGWQPWVCFNRDLYKKYL